MYQITRDDGSVRYRTDVFSRGQIGGGRKDPDHPERDGAWDGTRQDVKGTKSCSIVIDSERVTRLLREGVFPERLWQSDTEFWADEYDPKRPVPTTLAELVIYEMHVEGLGAGRPTPGTFEDAIAQLDRLAELGINAIELLPTAEGESWSWGYGSSHHFATEYAGGGRDELKHFVRACHRRDIAVLMDVVYNHWVGDGERCQWEYDSASPEKNLYYWYEGPPSRWRTPDGGYLGNGSSGYTPNFRNELVRRIFTSSALVYLSEFHIDGFRVDLTQAIHRDNVISANGEPSAEANRYGVRLLREWVRTLRLVKPSVLLFAEDYTGWPAITEPQDSGGIGFDAIWWVEWYHNLIGDSQNSSDDARMIHEAGFGDNRPLAMSKLAARLMQTGACVVYNESHDQAGNATYNDNGEEVASARTIQVAVNGFLQGNRWWAEARCRVAFGLTVFSSGTPMFFMGEEVGASEPYRYDDWISHREDFGELGKTTGRQLQRFYRDAIWLRRSRSALKSGAPAIVHAHDGNRVLAFRRSTPGQHLLVVASLANTAFEHGYALSDAALPEGQWREVLNSDAAVYGGNNLGNPGVLRAANGTLNVRIPRCGLVVLEHING
jgi:1,4-alpha-glucan branching enzyme